jgi:hypothetical protein
MIVIYASSSLALVRDIALTRSIIYNRNMFTTEIVTYDHNMFIVQASVPIAYKPNLYLARYFQAFLVLLST